MLAKELIHGQIVRRLKQMDDWFEERRKGISFPVYSSFDIRDAGFKSAVVDANIFPAGFNNICQVDRENAPDLFQSYINRHYGEKVQNILLLTEEHTNNAYYWENVRAIEEIIESSGRKVKIAMPRELDEPLQATSINGHELTIHSAKRIGETVSLQDFEPDLILSNNDFSESYEEWSANLKTPMNPPRELGWYRRKKSCYFEHYNVVVAEFAEFIDVDPWLLQVNTKVYGDFDLSNEARKTELAEQVEKQLKFIREKYHEHGVDEEPFLMMKNNSGTYGLAVIQVRSGDDIMSFNYKSRKKMKAAKGGGHVEEVILQEGIPTSITQDGEVAEPAIYMIGCNLAGGFLRAHGKKGPRESLNSPGAVYKRLCVSDLNVSVEGHPLENVYGWLARLGLLAVGRESSEMKVEYLQYR